MFRIPRSRLLLLAGFAVASFSCHFYVIKRNATAIQEPLARSLKPGQKDVTGNSTLPVNLGKLPARQILQSYAFILVADARRPVALSEASVRTVFESASKPDIVSLGPTPTHCGLRRSSNWTLHIHRRHVHTSIGLSGWIRRAWVPNGCAPCQIPSPPLIVRSEHLLRHYDALLTLGAPTAAFYLALEGSAGGLSCPAAATSTGSTAQHCAGLPLAFDPSFALLPRLTGLYRLEVEGAGEFWLGCSWSASLVDSAGRDVACSAWVVELLRLVHSVLGDLAAEHWLVFGSVLGAVRRKGPTPWSLDGDLMLRGGPGAEAFRRRWRTEAEALSGGRLSALARDGLAHLTPIRAFPACPVRLGGSEGRAGPGEEASREAALGREVARLPAACPELADWRSGGYVDVYDWREGSPEKVACLPRNASAEGSVLNVSGLLLPGPPQPEKFLACAYGPNFMRPPRSYRASSRCPTDGG